MGPPKPISFRSCWKFTVFSRLSLCIWSAYLYHKPQNVKTMKIILRCEQQRILEWYTLTATCKSEFDSMTKFFLTGVTTNTRLWRFFFSCVFVDVNQLFPWFSTRSDRKGSLIAEWRANNFERQRLFTKLILLRWRITLLKQRGLCELSETAETFSIVYVTVFRLFIYLMKKR